MNNEILDEHLFWLQILGDHARFIKLSLSVTETQYIEMADQYISIFDHLLDIARSKNLSNQELVQLSKQAEKYAKDIREFKLLIMRNQLTGDVQIGFTPSFLNHMVNEVEEYIRILPYLINQENPPAVHPIHHHLVWLLDAAGHAGAINCSLDRVEKDLKKKSQKFLKQFEDFYIKAVEMAGYLRANVSQFPALSRFNKQASLEITIFQEFLKELEEMEIDETILSSFSPLMADHMYREECYYLKKVAESSDLNKPNCNPAKPRTTKK